MILNRLTFLLSFFVNFKIIRRQKMAIRPLCFVIGRKDGFQSNKYTYLCCVSKRADN